MTAAKRWDAYSAWFTSGDLGEQGLWAASQMGVDPDVVIDLGAGAGGITSRIRHVWPDAKIVAIEAREEEREHLERWADVVIIADFRTLDPADPRLQGARVLITGNPPYTDTSGESSDLTTQAIEWSFLVARWVHFLLRKSYEESEAASAYFLPDFEGGRPPIADFRIPGRASFRRGVNARGGTLAGDFLGHRWVLWEPGTHGWSWLSTTLPPLPSTSLSYAIRPGTELVAGRLYEALRPRLGHRIAKEGA